MAERALKAQVGRTFGFLELSKPHSMDAAHELIRIVSKLSPIVDTDFEDAINDHHGVAGT